MAEIPEDMLELVKVCVSLCFESAAEADDELMEKYLGRVN